MDYNGWCCIFNIDGQYYLGSLTFRTDCDFGTDNIIGVQCIIFKCDSTGQFTFKDALGECECRSCEYSPSGLSLCVEDFIKYRH